MADLINLIDGYQKQRVFGVPLESLLETEGREIPLICEKSIEDLRRRGLDIEGIFRIPGDTKNVKELKQAYDSERGPDLNIEAYSPHDVGGLFKLFFRELPNPLFLFASFPHLLAFYGELEANGGDNSEYLSTFLDKLAKLIASLPESNQKLLRYLFNFFTEIVAQSAVNMMNSRNVAVVFAPNLIRPLVDTMETALLSPQVNKVLSILIDHNDPQFWELVDRHIKEGSRFDLNEVASLPKIKLIQTESPAPKIRHKRGRIGSVMPMKRGKLSSSSDLKGQVEEPIRGHERNKSISGSKAT